MNRLPKFLFIWEGVIIGFIIYHLMFPPIIDTTTIIRVQNEVNEVVDNLDYEYVEARITCYAPTGYNMANTKPPKDGWVATSDRTIPFNTIVEVRGKEYKVGDRTAKWVHEKHGLTIDIFMESGCDRNFGAKKEMIKIYK